MKKPKFKKPIFNKKRMERVIRKVFLNSSIVSYKKLEGGLVHTTFKVKIKDPDKDIVVRISKNKNLTRIQKNNKILNYLNDSHIPAPKIYLEMIYARQLITIMEFLEGNDGETYYTNASKKKKEVILKNAGRNLRKIHNLPIQFYWQHQTHEVRTKKEWLDWIDLRIEKYLKFSKGNLKEFYPFIEKEFKELQELLKSRKDFKIVPLHWDYHLANLIINSKGEVTGVFDFDNAMKGDRLADIGQFEYWLKFRTKGHDNFKYFLKGYGGKFSKVDEKLIRGYYILFLVAVTRTVWPRQPRLSWIVNDHMKILRELSELKKF